MPYVRPVTKSTVPDRMMWITPDRVFYLGLLGAPTVRQMGSVLVYVSVAGSAIRIRLDGGEWQRTEMAVVPPYVPHQVMSESRTVIVMKVEAETVDLGALPPRIMWSRGIGCACICKTRARTRLGVTGRLPSRQPTGPRL